MSRRLQFEDDDGK
ncbi:hypothetical protein B4U80_09408 [Leptotrombidium deliense]|uniref:Uncharacterized protein n=1 Tax=Leptotrombidium deliense TaxID=299467 RepID=A0A443S0N7_9ACAR|nr:hypothetical protein B4U80_09408 [Leptotrombidium deliense]